MLGGGFLKQGHDSFKQNREVRKRAVEGSFVKENYRAKSMENPMIDDSRLSDSIKTQIRARVLEENKQRMRRLLTLLAIASTIVIILFVWLIAFK